MTFRMPVRNLRQEYARMLPALDEIVDVVRSTPAEVGRYTKHLNRRGVIFQYAYYAALVKQTLAEGAVVCDWGGQYGHLTRILRDHFPNTVCYLPDPDAGLSMEYFHARFGVADAVRLGPGYGTARIDIPDGTLDGVISSGVLEHTREYGVAEEDSLREIWRILRPGGTLFIWMLPRRWGSVELLNSALGRSIHPFKYTRSSVVRLLDGAGFRIDLLDQHELLNLSSRNALGRMIGYVTAWNVDYYASKVFLAGALAQWFTVVAHKP